MSVYPCVNRFQHFYYLIFFHKFFTLVPNFHFSFRFELLQLQLSQLELFDQALLTLTQRSENFLSVLRSSSQVDIADLEAAITKLKVRNQ